MTSQRRMVAVTAMALVAASVLGACSKAPSTAGAPTGTEGGTGTTVPPPLSSSPDQPLGGAVEIKIVSTPYGKAIGRGNGRVLYAWDKEVDAGDGVAQCVSQECVDKWPPFTATAMTFGDGVDNTRFSLVDRPDGTTQVAIDGKRLYMMAVDAPGEANCQGLDGWWILNPDGSKNTNTTPASGSVPRPADPSGPTTTAFNANTTTTRRPTTTTTAPPKANGAAPTTAAPTTPPTTAPPTTRRPGY